MKKTTALIACALFLYVTSALAQVPQVLGVWEFDPQASELPTGFLRTERAFPSRFRDARGAKVGRPLRGATRTPTNWAERVDWHGACSAPHTAEGEPR